MDFDINLDEGGDLGLGSMTSLAARPASMMAAASASTSKLSLPPTCQPPSEENPPKQLVWMVSNSIFLQSS